MAKAHEKGEEAVKEEEEEEENDMMAVDRSKAIGWFDLGPFFFLGTLFGWWGHFWGREREREKKARRVGHGS